MSLTLRKNTNILLQNKKILFFAFLGLCIILGLYFRIKGLSNGGFANSDEYYIAKSVHNILEYGLPKYPLGGYYTRGLIYQYLSALLLLTGIREEFALRFIPLIFNILTIPAVYLLAKKIGDKALIASIIFLFCFSILEIEYSRLARYYTPFQMLFTWYIYFLYKTVVEKNHKSYKWMIFLSITAVFMYEGSIFMVVLNFVPFVLNKEKINFTRLSYTMLILIAALLYLRFDFRNYGTTNYLPTDVQLLGERNIAPIDLPHIFIATFPSVNWYLLLLIPLTVTIIYGFYILKKTSAGKVGFIFIAFAFISLFNLFGIILISFIIFYLVGWITFENLKSKSFYLLILILLLNFIFYLVYGLATNSWLIFFPEESHISINKIFWVFINYPDLYQKIFIPWFRPVPYFIIICISSIAGYFAIFMYKSKKETKDVFAKANFLLAIIIFLVTSVAILKTPYNDVRYTFFIYPLILLFLLFSMQSIAKFLTKKRTYAYSLYFIFLALFIILSSDFNPNHILKIDSKEVRFRTIYSALRERMYYEQEDYMTPANVINKNALDNDIIITTEAPITIEYYLKRLDYIYIDYKDGEFTGRSRLNGKKEIWTGANLIYKEQDFLNILKDSKSTIWLSDFSKKRYITNSLEEKINKEYSKYLYYVNYDSTINVYRIPPNSKHSQLNPRNDHN